MQIVCFRCGRVFQIGGRVSSRDHQDDGGFPQLSSLRLEFFSAAASFSLFHHGFRPLFFNRAPLRVGCSPSSCPFVKSDTRPTRTLSPTPALKHLHAASAHFLAKSFGGTRCVTKGRRRGRRKKRRTRGGGGDGGFGEPVVGA